MTGRHVTRREIAEIDRRSIEEFGIPNEALMDRAGGAVAAEVERRWPGRPVVALCGTGKNGGDGRIAAGRLKGRDVRIVEPGGTWSIPAGAVVIDALFGTGLNREVTGAAREAIEAVNRLDRAEHPVIAVDVPSGLDADTGRPLGVAVRATVTVAMGLPKVGFLEPAAREYLGEVVIADIGHPAELIRG